MSLSLTVTVAVLSTVGKLTVQWETKTKRENARRSGNALARLDGGSFEALNLRLSL
jgi:hypothetical protein